ncbi:MAG: hypothetical protein A2096_15590 [Spirochaetes bacterium GWF1_41_5]|nr:MAG: hypothetical protein A2096_15590 [Spirochaetes bacterium GWF1_41_5]
MELVDVSDPGKPRHLSTVRTGEAQSCVVRDCILYVGVWFTSELVICDVSNPRRPVIISKMPLDGFGDGVFVQGKYCFAATGSHSRKMKERNERDPEYGGGHGLEIFDISNPKKPKFAARIKMPRLYRRQSDFWNVIVSGDYAFVADTYNGVFVVDISDINKPCFAGHQQLPWVESEKVPDSVSGIALGKGVIYTSGRWTDLHVINAPMARPVTPEPDKPPVIPPEQTVLNEKFNIYKPDGQVWAAAFIGDIALAACGSAGLHAVQLLPEIKKLAEYKTESFAVDVKVNKNLVYVAESEGGLSIWKVAANATLEPVGRFRVPGQSVKQVVVPKNGKYALLDVGRRSFIIIDITDPYQPRKVFEANGRGLLYGYQITDGLFENRYACCLWHGDGYFWYDLAGSEPVFSGDHYQWAYLAWNGLAVLPNGADGILTEPDGKYIIINRQERRPLDEIKQYGIHGHNLSGKPSVYGNRLYTANRFWGRVNFVDISNIEKPKLIDTFTLDGNPNLVVEHSGYPVIPAGYQGLLVYKEKLG